MLRDSQIPVWPIVVLIMIVAPAIGYLLPLSQETRNERDRKRSTVAEPSRSDLPTTGKNQSDLAQPDPKSEQKGPVEEQKVASRETVKRLKETAKQSQDTPPVTAPSIKKNPAEFEVGKQPSPSIEREVKRKNPETVDHSTPRTTRPLVKQGQQPVLMRHQIPPSSTARTGVGEKTSSDVKDPEEKKAYQILLAHASVARKLADGGFHTLRFANWKTVQRKGSEIWIDLIANHSDGETVHFIWSVNMQDETFRPLSEAARNLERNQLLP